MATGAGGTTAPRTTVPHLRLSFGGTLGASGQEIWSCTLKLVSASGGTGGHTVAAADSTQGALQTAVTAMAGHLRTFHAAFAQNNAFLAYAKLNVFGANDLQETDPTVETQFNPVAGGTSGQVPWSTALVLENRALGRSHGFASHGRISYPASLSVNNATGKITQAGQGTVAAASAAYATLLENLFADSPSGGYAVAIVYTSTNAAKPAAASIVDRCFASDIPGEIRRRQNKLTQGSPAVVVTGVD